MTTMRLKSLEGLTPHQLQQRLVGLETLVDVTRNLAAEIDLLGILRRVTTDVCKALDCERASLFQFDSRKNELFTRFATELEVSELRHPIDQGITGSVARSRQLANVSNPAADPRWNSGYDMLTGFQTRNILAAPISSPHGNRLLGVLELINKRGRSFDAFDEELLQAFTQHAAVALDRADLVDTLRKRTVLESSLNVAREIQRGFMPSRLPPVPGYEMACWWFPNEEVGGDYCDVLPLMDGRTGLIIADVSGHGIGPSLIMASVRAALRALLLGHSSAEIMLDLLGQSLDDDLQDGRFITMIFASLDPVAHVVEYANAGHAPALHYVAKTRDFGILEPTGMPLGVISKPDYPQGPPVYLEVGDLLVLCTDGIVEAMNEQNEQFGLKRLKSIIDTHSKGSVDDLVKRIGAEVSSHYEGDNPPDDLTILAARRNQ